MIVESYTPFNRGLDLIRIVKGDKVQALPQHEFNGR